MTEPTSRGVPSGSRYSAAVDGKSAKIAFAASVWAKNVGSTTKPRFAVSMPGFSASRSEVVPNSRSAVSHARSVPGTPTLMPLTRWCSKSVSPSKLVAVPAGVIAAGAVSRESIVWTFPSRAE